MEIEMNIQSTAPKKRGRRKKEDSDDGRQRIVADAKAVFEKVDPLLVNRLTLAERIGVDPNLIRYYFGNMQQLIAEVVADTHRRARTDMSAGRKNDQPLDRLHYRIQRTFRLFKDNPHHHKMVTSLLDDSANREARKEWASILDESLDDLSHIIASGVRQGTMRQVDPHFLHMLIIGACEFWCANPVVLDIVFARAPSDMPREQAYVEFLYEILSRGLAPAAS
jgi:TetR/AcrR family transcriptional regulator